ncbi:amidohydrolase family protein [Nocardioides sp. CER19]|uniref:N-acetylglucosamine-6-phosphate deacetylase n=1 Tax=Nocardioides sp. CER19 TaxID=3038538 RepID=UPI00244BAFA1|nr:amidohydrolase family protein [Nocardioides sp. CER19]MDH2414081.1 amidohydrolase family protein [Nocardioides sp. CER19]
MTVLRGRLVTPTYDGPGEVLVEDDRIAAVTHLDPGDGSGTGASDDPVILPGLVDVHCHGGGGAAFTSGSVEEARTAATHHLRHGTTTLLGSLVTDAPDRMLHGVALLADLVDEGLLAGIHLEGPFLSPERCGAQDPRHLLAPDATLAARLLEAGRGHVRVVTIAAELPGAAELAAQVAAAGAVAALGHTAAPFPAARELLRSPATALVTHLFNGMPGLHHRDPGPVGAALAAARAGDAVVELIADGVHLSDDTVTTVFALLGADAIVLVTDAMAAAGMPDGRYRLGPQEVVVADGVATLARNDSLAGGTTRLVDVVGRLARLGLPASEVVRAATDSPARAVGLEAPSLRVGDRADLVVADRDLRPHQVMKAGRWVADGPID